MPILDRLWADGFVSRVSEGIMVGEQGFLRPVATWHLTFKRGTRAYDTAISLTRFGAYACIKAAASIC
jgi:hypothetical protein